MKKAALLIFLIVCCTIAQAQSTSLVIDNQNPGWLSSKINYGDQKTLRNLTVTGYINRSDILFINQLIGEQQLHGRLDLTDVEIVGKTRDDDNAIIANYVENCCIWGKLEHLLLPRKLKRAYWACCHAHCDTITLGGPVMNHINFEQFLCGENASFDSSYDDIKTIIFREGVDSIGGDGTRFYLPNLTEVHFPSTLKYIAPEAFYLCFKLQKANLPDSLEEIGNRAFLAVPAFKDTVVVPRKIETYYIGSFGYLSYEPITTPEEVYVHKGQKIFLSDNIKQISFGGVAIDNPIYLHIRSLTPPTLSALPYYNTKRVNAYVPKSSLDLYLNNEDWSKFNLFAEPNPVIGISLNKDSINLQKTQEFQLEVSFRPVDADSQNIIWRSGNDNIAIISSTGKVTAKSSGYTYIYVSCADNSKLRDSCLVTVYQPVSSIRLDKNEKKVNVGDTFLLTADVLPADADNKKIIWSSENNEIATVEDGKVTGRKAGTVNIVATAESDSTISAKCAITVLQPVEDITLDLKSYQFDNIGEAVNLMSNIIPDNASNKNVIWKSSDEKVCVVSNGKVVALGYGIAVIMAITEDGNYMATCTITVNNTTDIKDVKDNTQIKYSIYSTDGKKHSNLLPGINIIKFSNGVTKKIFVSKRY